MSFLLSLKYKIIIIIKEDMKVLPYFRLTVLFIGYIYTASAFGGLLHILMLCIGFWWLLLSEFENASPYFIS